MVVLYMVSNLMEEIVVWQIAPNEDHVILNGEVGIPYISLDGSNWLAIMRDGMVIDSISIDITKSTIVGVISQNRNHAFDFWDDGSDRLIANPNIVKKAMRNRATLLDAGWSYEFALHILLLVVEEATKHTSDPFNRTISYIGEKNIEIGMQYYILSRAVEAYELYMNEFDSKRRLKLQAKKATDVCESFEMMNLAILIALINPCVDRQWEYIYNRQGARSQDMSQNRLTETMNVLQEKLDKLSRALYLMESVIECHDDEECEIVRSEIMAVQKTLEIFENDNNYNAIKGNVYIAALKAAKAMLTFSSVPCGTNTIEQEWTKFVATAWEVTPSQVVSAAKALKRLESQEQK